MDKEKKNLLVFGYGLALIIGFFLWRHAAKTGHFGVVSLIFLSIAVVMAVVTALDYRLIKPVYKKWMVVAHLVGKCVTGLILSIIFYFIFGTVGLVLRLLGKDHLDRKLEPERPSYWIKRGTTGFDKASYEKQF